jgi:hypothetical protein
MSAFDQLRTLSFDARLCLTLGRCIVHKATKLDRSLTVLFSMALLLVLLDGTSALLFATLGITFLGMVKASMALTAVFAITGVGFGLLRAQRRGTATSRRRA